MNLKEKALGGNHSGSNSVKSSLKSSIWKAPRDHSSSSKLSSDEKKLTKNVSIDEFGVRIQTLSNDRLFTRAKRASSIQQPRKNILESSLPKYRPKSAAGNEKIVHLQILENAKTPEKDAALTYDLPYTSARDDIGKSFQKGNEAECNSARSVGAECDRHLKTTYSVSIDSSQSSFIALKSPIAACADLISSEQAFHESDSVDLDDVESLLGDVVSPTVLTPALPKSKLKRQSISCHLGQQASRLPKLSQASRNLSYSRHDAESLFSNLSKKSQNSATLPENHHSQLYDMLNEEQFNAFLPFPLTPNSSASATNDEYFNSPFSGALSQAKKFASISQTLLPDPTPSPVSYMIPKEFNYKADALTLQFEHAYHEKLASERKTKIQILDTKLAETHEGDFWQALPMLDHARSKTEGPSEEDVLHTQFYRSIRRSALDNQENFYLYKESIRRRLYSNILNVKGHWLHASNMGKRDVESLQMGRHLINNMLRTLDFFDCII